MEKGLRGKKPTSGVGFELLSRNPPNLLPGFLDGLGVSGQVRPRQGTEICNVGAPSPLEALHWNFGFFSSIYVQCSKTSPLKSGESSEKSSGEIRVKSCHVCGCHGFLQWNPKYGWKGTVTTRFALIALVAWQY